MSKEQGIKAKIKQWTQEERPLLQASHIYSWLRLAAIVLALVLSIYADQSGKTFGFYLAGSCLLFFLVLVYQHNKVKEQLREKKALRKTGEFLCKRMENLWQREPSRSVCEKEDVLAYDLDLLGEQSLFDFLSICATPFGKQILTAWLKGEEDDLSQVKQRQGAVQELLQNEDFLLLQESRSFLFEEDARNIKQEDLSFLIQYGQTESNTFPKYMVKIAYVMSISCILTLLLASLKILSFGIPAVLLLVNLIISLIIASRTQKALFFTKDLTRVLKDYTSMFEPLATIEFQDPYLCSIQTMMLEAKQGWKSLNQVMTLIALRHNILSYFILAACCQIDVFCVAALERWRKQYGTHMETWLMHAGTLEALLSLCVLGQVKEVICFPELLDQTTPYLMLEGANHPLLWEGKAVKNSVELKNGSYIITGSNMSGKTTFLRTVGISMMLARAGTCVNALAMRCVLMDVYTSMRVKDDVSEGISTFYAELLRISQMMKRAKQKQGMLVLIDEIFKGTNSADRILCAKTAIKKLHQPWIITMVSTHDFELCALEQDTDIHAQNYHFSEYYEHEEIRFDYLLKPGKCTSTNALALMRLAGILDRKEDDYEC